MSDLRKDLGVVFSEIAAWGTYTESDKDKVIDAFIKFAAMWDDEEYISNDELKAELEALKVKK